MGERLIGVGLVSPVSFAGGGWGGPAKYFRWVRLTLYAEESPAGPPTGAAPVATLIAL